MKIRMPVIIALVWLLPIAVQADGYPYISDIPNQQLNVNSSSGPLNFQISDDETPSEQLALSAISSNPSLIPADGSHVRFSGQGSNRTVTFTPLQGQSGFASVSVVVTDPDGNNNRDSVDIEVLSSTDASQSLEN